VGLDTARRRRCGGSRSHIPRLLCSLLVAAALAQPTRAAEPPPSAAASPSAAQHFAVHEYRVLGNTVLPNREIERVLYPRLGDSKTIEDVQAARAALEEVYHKAGYATVFVDVPPQEVTDSVVRLRVTEGRVRVRTISGARYFSEGKILEALPETQPGQVPRLPELQRELNAVNTQTADRSVVPVLKAGPEPGTMDLALKVDDHLPLHGSLDFNNQYSPDTRPLRATLALSYANLFGDLDSLAAQYTTAVQKSGQVEVFNTTYGFHPLGDGIRPSISFTNSASNVVTVGTLGVLGDGQIYSGRLSIPLSALGDFQTLTLGLDYKHFRNTIALASSPAEIEPISYVNASLTYADSWQRVGQSGTLPQAAHFDIAVDVGPRGLANQTANFASSRYMAQGNYAYLHSDGSLTLGLPAQLVLIVRATGQLTLDPLVIYEQQSIGGADGVRGYLEAEVLGDSVLKGTTQLQSRTLTLSGFTGDLFVFFDAGHAYHLEALPGEQSVTNLRSFGAGFEFLRGRYLTGSFTWAEALVNGPYTTAHASRVLFDLRGSF
jgi:hemolysin activation/secretion protein